MIRVVPAQPKQATLTLLLEQGESSAANLASLKGVSVQAMRRHLRSLEDDGLVEATMIVGGPGRPLNLWQLTKAGLNIFHDNTENFTLDILDTIKDEFSPEMFLELLSKQINNKAKMYQKYIGIGHISSRLKKLVELRTKEGYLAECLPSKDGSVWYVKESNCAILTIAEKYPVFCDQELELIRKIFPDCTVERVQWRFDQGHACGFSISLDNASE